jgi:DNA-binding ferritin-like protein (Dps family)
MLLGSNSPERYIVFNQNRDEIRTNGGFPGSIITFTMFKGNISDYRTDDVYYYDWNLYPFIWLCSDPSFLLDGCTKLNTFLNRLEQQAAQSLEPNDYKGSGFELFCEALINLSPVDKRIGINNYKPITHGDTGVDGKGTGINGSPATVQCKFRQANYVLTANADHLSNFVMSSYGKFGVRVEDTDNMLIITSGKDIHHFTEVEMFDKKVRTLNREQLRKLVDNNAFFWDSFRTLFLSARAAILAAPI